MTKEKIAISIDSEILKQVDSKIDNSIIRSRSQAIELFLKRGLSMERIRRGILMVSKNHQKKLFSTIKGEKLISRQAKLFKNHRIDDIHIITQRTSLINDLLIACRELGIKLNVIDAKNNGQALKKSGLIEKDCVVMNGNILIDFDLTSMIESHMKDKRIATIGLMSKKDTKNFGNIIMDGDRVFDFTEKPKNHKSNIVNAGIYIFSREVNSLIDNRSLETGLLPRLVSQKQLSGHFIRGSYYN